MNVGYFTIPHNSQEASINMDYLMNMKVVEEGRFIKHVQFDTDLQIIMDGKNRQAVIKIDE